MLFVTFFNKPLLVNTQFHGSERIDLYLNYPLRLANLGRRVCRRHNAAVLLVTCIDLLGPGEEARDVVLHDSERRVEILEHPHHRVVSLHSSLRSLQRAVRVERSVGTTYS